MRSTFRVCTILFLLCTSHAFAQKAPYYIRNYTPKEYNGFNQMWQAVQDKNGLLYFAGTSKIFLYDGTNFSSVAVKSGAANRQLYLDSTDQTIYVGAVSDFGYLQPDSAFGKPKFVSLTDQLTEKQKEFSDIWSVTRHDGKIYFQSTERIFVCKDKKIIRVIEAPKDKSFALMFGVAGHLYVRQRTVGLMEIKNDQLVLTPGGERFATVRILGIMRWRPDENLILSSDSGFYRMKTAGYGQTMYSKYISDDFLANAGVLGCTWVNDSTFGVNSRSGMAFYTRDVKLIEVLDKSTGLADQSISTVFIDHQKNLWLLHNYGMSKVCYNSPMLYFHDDRGYTGTVECMTRYRGQLYLASTEGLFVQPAGTSDENLQFVRDEEIPRTEVWDLAVIDSALYISTNEGLFIQRGSKPEQLSKIVTNRIVRSAPGEIIAMEKGGFSILHTSASAVTLVHRYEMPGVDLIHVSYVDTAAGGKRDTWCSDRFKRAIHLQFDIHDTDFKAAFYDTANGLPQDQIYPAFYNGSVYFLKGDSAYRYDASKDTGPGAKCFVPAPDVFKRLAEGDLTGLRGDFDSRNYLARPTLALSTFIGNGPGGTYLSYSIMASYFTGNTVVQFVFPEPSGMVWILGEDMIGRYNTKRKIESDIPYNATIRAVIIANDSAIYDGNDLVIVRTEALPYRFNSITFYFSALTYEYDQPMHYYYMLEGYDTTWYESKKLREKSYTNLHEGTYVFHVKAINGLGKTSAESTYTFTISPPWYRTNLAYSLYGISFIASILLSIRLGARRLRKQKEKLEHIVSERTAEVVEQKQMIEEQKAELESAYDDMRDSIQYAKRIQQAILPVQDEFARAFPDSFVLFRPRDIVSGDFYWFAHRDNKSFVACVDCTGHGVPGAFMSMIGNTLLNEIVLEKKIETPDKILDTLHVRVRQALHQDAGGETRDGMDIALCVIDHATDTLAYAGANRPLWFLRNGELQEIKADKYPIAGDQHEAERHFKPHFFSIAKGDCFYMSTDGYADQFGGPKGKKFMVKRLQELLIGIHQKPVAEQKTILDETFLQWEGDLEQVDDVLVIGFRI